jgi:pimeloyl-ACP methyl ester carboxylesterase
MKYIFFLMFTLLFPVVLNAEPSRPVVFIPGIFGSELSANGKKLWGGIWSLNNLRQLTIISGPRKPDDSIEAKEVIKEVSVFGIIKVVEYARTLYPLLKAEGYETKNGNFFVFPYDWRQSNYDTAKRLQDFMDTPPLKGKQVDMIAHSMGGLVAQIYIKNLEGANRVKKLINLAVPFRGSVDTLRTLTDGWGTVQNGLAGGLGIVRRFALTMPSFYEMLPDYRYCCILGREEDPKRTPYNLFDYANWSEIRWLDDPVGISADGVREALHRGAELRALATQPYPSNMRVYYIAGAGIDTTAQYYVDTNEKTISTYKQSTDRYQGDGTVIEKSASNGDLSQAFSSFAEHQTIFNDDSAKTTLRRILCETCGAPDNYGFRDASAFTTDGKILSVTSAGVITSQNYIKAGETVTSELRIRGEGASPNKADVTLQLAYVSDGVEEILKEVALDGSLEAPSTGLYKSEIRGLNKVGPLRIKYMIKGMATLSDYVIVLPKDDQ